MVIVFGRLLFIILSHNFKSGKCSSLHNVSICCYFRLIRNVGPAKAITVTYLIPAFAMFWGAIVIDEKVTPIMIIGSVIIFFGTALATGMLSFGRR